MHPEWILKWQATLSSRVGLSGHHHSNEGSATIEEKSKPFKISLKKEIQDTLLSIRSEARKISKHSLNKNQ
ncbi:hypothetical protein KR52_11320 [Synechococcus sp. KORDI-52]|nr:hypothetical protein KR52_11320 [Synechococcus sp. KORDI-52]